MLISRSKSFFFLLKKSQSSIPSGVNPEIDYLAVSPARSPWLKATAKTKPFIYYLSALKQPVLQVGCKEPQSLYPALQVSRRDQSPNLCL